MIYITSDTTADLGSLFSERGVKTIPLTVILGNEMCFDGVDVDPDKIYNFVSEEGILPKTSARSVEEYKEFFASVKSNSDDEIVHFSLSSGVSITCHNAMEAAKEVGNVFVVDGKSLSSGTGLLVLYACDLRDSGKYTASEIYEMANKRVDAVQASFVVDTMDYLHKGGRCSGVVAFAAGAIRIKPSLQLKDGKIVVGKKYMFKPTKAIAPQYVKNIFEIIKKL
jgi:DegV family protein with EDD domain